MFYSFFALQSEIINLNSEIKFGTVIAIFETNNTPSEKVFISISYRFCKLLTGFNSEQVLEEKERQERLKPSTGLVERQT